ncbi:MAG: phosphatase PAP2 family protein [Anaerolineales bacterium]|nr:phosphatase PAP2 family protein [Anaerolineales bacterium]
MGSFWQSGIDAVVWLQADPAVLTPIMQGFSFLGTTEFLLLLGLTVYWCIDARIGVRLGLLLISGAALGGILKLAFHMPRPYWVDPRVQALAGETGYGMPSMHAMNAWSIAPWLAGRIRRGWGFGLGVLLAFGISISRIHLGVHFPGDVLAGFIFGILVWFLVGAGLRHLGPILERAGFPVQCLAAAAASIFVLLSQSIILGRLAGTADPTVWAEHAARINLIQPRDPNPIISLAGLILGMGVGLACKNRWAPFAAGGSLEKRFLRFLLGLSVMLLLYAGPALLWNGIPSPLGPALRYLRYGLTGWWLIFLAPWLFLRWGLAARETPKGS